MLTSYIDFYSLHVEDLKKEGKEYLGYCPFHSDKGSKMKGFSVNPDSGLWFCHSGCGGGNAVSFCQKKSLDVKQAPDHDPNYQRYSYGGGILKMKPNPEQKAKGKNELWQGTKGEGLPAGTKPFNHQAIDHARRQNKILWICEGEKDTITMMEDGELAVGIPSATMDKVLDAVSLKGINKVIVACDNDDAGRKATTRILSRFPWASKIEWDSDKPKGYDLTDCKNDHAGNFIAELEKLVVEPPDPFCPLTKFIMDKIERDQSRDSNKLLGYKLEKFKTLAKNIDGVQPGFYVIGAETNVGKTALLCNLTLDLIDSNNDLTGIYFSLDDNKDVIVNRFLSIETGISLNAVQRRQPEKWVETLDNGHRYLYELAANKRLIIRDASEIKNISDLEQEIIRRMNRDLFVVIDGLYNLDVAYSGPDARKENIERANSLKRLADEYRIPVICTGELRKKDAKAKQDKIPTIHDLMETGKFAYNANLCLLIYPESWEEYDDEDEPILNMKYAKNKLSHIRTTGKIKFIRKTSQIGESESLV